MPLQKPGSEFIFLDFNSTCYFCDESHPKLWIMKKMFLSFLALMFVSAAALSQDDYIKGPALGIHFLFNDFVTAKNIRSTSLNTVLREKQFGKTKEMSPGIAVSYSQGLTSHVDFSGRLAGSFLDYPIEGRTSFGNESLLLEADASIHAKMFSDKYWVVPYLSAGLGASKYKGYYGAFIPLGAGIQVNFFDEAFFVVNSQYRLKVTDNANYHFFYSIGIVGNIGVKKGSTGE